MANEYVDPVALGLEPPKKTKAKDIIDRVNTGLADPVYGLAQLADKVAVDPFRQLISPGATSMTDIVKAREAEYAAPSDMDWARMAGNMLNPGNYVAPAGSVLTKSLAMSGIGGAATPVTDDNYWTEKGKQGAVAGTIGALTPSLSAFRPSLGHSAEANVLMEHGIQPSVGQARGGMTNRLEQLGASIPGVSWGVSAARNRGLDEWQGAILYRAMPGAKSVEEANQLASQLYERVVPHLKPRPEAFQLFGQARQAALRNPELTPANAQVLERLIADRTAKYGTLSGEGIKGLDSDLGALIRKYSSSSDVGHHAVADGLREMQGALRQSMEIGLPPDMQGAMTQANKTWRALIPINKAASSRADERVTPRALQKAIAQQARTDVTRMPADPLVDAAVKVLPSNVPDSGTAERLMTAGALGVGGVTGFLPEVAATASLARLGASRSIQQMLTGNTPKANLAMSYLMSPQQAAASVAALRGGYPRTQVPEKEGDYVDAKALGLE